MKVFFKTKIRVWIERGYALLFLFLPWSAEFSFGAWKLNLPSELLIALLGIGLFAFLKKSPPEDFSGGDFGENSEGVGISRFVNFLKVDKSGRPPLGFNLLTMSVLWVFWLGVCGAFSTLPLVSLKYWLVEAGHWWVFFGGMVLMPGLFRRVLPFFVFSMVGSAVFVLAHHGFYGFRPDQSNLAPMPFFADHTMYSMVLSMVLFLLPMLTVSGFGNFSNFRNPSLLKLLALLLAAALFLAGLYFSYCRAAWLSVFLAFGLGFVLFFHKKWRVFLAIAAATGVLLFFNFEKFSPGNFSKTSADGNARDLSGQLRSLTNFTTDASNLERLNRYSCARRMALEKPVFGFGPGTFQFQYLGFQRPEEMTRISIREAITDRNSSNYGRGGGAHSEYFQAVSEAGFPGLLIWLALVLAALRRGALAFLKNEKSGERWVWLGVFCCLASFFSHGLVNNFLHDGRVAALFWGVLAALELEISHFFNRKSATFSM